MFAIQGCVASEDRDKSYQYNANTHTRSHIYKYAHTYLQTSSRERLSQVVAVFH